MAFRAIPVRSFFEGTRVLRGFKGAPNGKPPQTKRDPKDWVEVCHDNGRLGEGYTGLYVSPLMKEENGKKMIDEASFWELLGTDGGICFVLLASLTQGTPLHNAAIC